MNKLSLKFLLFIGLLIGAHRLCLWLQPFGPLLKDQSFSQQIVDRDGKLLRLSLADDEIYRLKTDLAEISPLIVKGTLLFEDRYFFYHFGVNPLSLVRAVWLTYVKKSRRVGASTITMQLARKLYGQSTRSIKGKLWQIVTAFYLEFFYSKKDILEAYLNIAPYGYNIEGVGAATRIFFDEEPNQVTLLQALTLSVIPQSPYQRTRHISQRKMANSNLKKVRNQLFQAWLESEPKWQAKQSQFHLEFEMRPPFDLPFLTPHLSTHLLLHEPGGRIQTTVDSAVQSVFESLTAQYVESGKKVGLKNASVLLVDTHTMEALSYVGSAQFSNPEILGQVNGLEARRSPGSALKPFVFGMAIDQGIIHPQSMLKDAPTPFGTYTPDNFDNKFAGPLSATDALVLSRNIPALNLETQLEEPGLYSLLNKVGIPLNPDSEHYGLSIVLGSAEVTMKELLELYAALNNEGVWQEIKTYTHQTGKSDGFSILSKEASFLVLEMLRQNTQPEMERLNPLRIRPQSVAWKTGTSVGYRDAWAIAVFDHYALGVWVGNFSGKGNTEFVGRKAAGPLLFQLIEAFAKVKSVEFKTPDPPLSYNLTSLDFCSRSGHLPNDHCPHRQKGWFIPGVSPISRCDIHRKIKVDSVTGMQVCPRFEGETKQLVFEYWPSDILKIFKEAGMGRKQPPTVHPKCQGVAYGDVAPKILSPKQGIQYNLRSLGTGSEQIPLVATADADIRSLTWFVNNVRLGDTTIDQPMLWTAVAGNHQLRVVDDQGRSTEIQFQVKRID